MSSSYHIHIFTHPLSFHIKHRKILASLYHIKHTWYLTSCLKLNHSIVETNNQIREESSNKAHPCTSLAQAGSLRLSDRSSLKLGILTRTRARTVSTVMFLRIFTYVGPSCMSEISLRLKLKLLA